MLDCDASNVGVVAVLSQLQDGEEKVISYFSKYLSKSDRQHCTTRKELLAMVIAVKHFHHYLLGQSFTIRTDHGSLQSKKISNDQELIQSDPTSCPQNQKGNN